MPEQEMGQELGLLRPQRSVGVWGGLWGLRKGSPQSRGGLWV